MPFDGKQVETPAIRRAVLIDALRNLREYTWNWDFTYVVMCGTTGCAIGLARQIWPDANLDILGANPIDAYREPAKFFGIAPATAYYLFGSAAKYPTNCMFTVTPEMVADALERVA